MKNITVIDAKGMLGFAVAEYLESRGYRVQRVTYAEGELQNVLIGELEPYLLSADTVVNCAGISKQMVHRFSSEELFRINAILPRTISLLCKRSSVPYIQISSERVFSGERGPYMEDDIPDAFDLYGMSKSAGEGPHGMVLRTSVIGEEPSESHSLAEWAKHQHGRTMEGIVNHHWNGVTNVHLAEIIERILENDAYAEGVFHLYSPNSVSNKELLEIINQVFLLDMQIEPVEAKHRCDRTLSSRFSLSQMFCTKTIQMQMYEMKEFYELIHAAVPGGTDR